MSDVQEFVDGVWLPAVPLPFYRGRLFGYQCAHPVYDGLEAAWCGRREAHLRDG
jgi:hypothetical protein